MRRTIRILTAAILIAVASASAVQAKTKVAPNSFQVPPGWPKLLLIPRFAVNAPVEDLSLFNPQDAHAPRKWGDVGWYKWGFRPGEVGHAVIFGHLDSTCCPAVFYHLRDMVAGNQVQIVYPTSQLLTFRIIWVKDYVNGALPTKWIFSPASQRGLVLVTCTGVFHRGGSGYDHKFVAYARLVLPNGKLG